MAAHASDVEERFDLDALCAFTAPKTVKIRDCKLGLMYNGLVLAGFLMLFCDTIVYKCNHLQEKSLPALCNLMIWSQLDEGHGIESLDEAPRLNPFSSSSNSGPSTQIWAPLIRERHVRRSPPAEEQFKADFLLNHTEEEYKNQRVLRGEQEFDARKFNISITIKIPEGYDKPYLFGWMSLPQDARFVHEPCSLAPNLADRAASIAWWAEEGLGGLYSIGRMAELVDKCYNHLYRKSRPLADELFRSRSDFSKKLTAKFQLSNKKSWDVLGKAPLRCEMDIVCELFSTKTNAVPYFKTEFEHPYSLHGAQDEEVMTFERGLTVAQTTSITVYEFNFVKLLTVLAGYSVLITACNKVVVFFATYLLAKKAMYKKLLCQVSEEQNRGPGMPINLSLLSVEDAASEDLLGGAPGKSVDLAWPEWRQRVERRINALDAMA